MKINIKKIWNSTFIFPIKIYQLFISPMLPNTCRHLPTCSDYTIDAIEHFGDFKKSHFHYQKSLSINPSYTEIYRLMSMTKKFQKGDEDIEIIKNKINDKNLAEIKKSFRDWLWLGRFR